jgi:hypothetical protein
MIIVTGTKRAGTSAWMQILAAAGFPVIGERFPSGWREALGAANVDGFFESELVGGIHWRTNPHPVTGRFLFPEQTRRHAVKVFVPGLVRSDLAFIDRVIATMRHPAEYVASITRLRELARPDANALELDPALEWWCENFALVRDLSTRRYAVHVTSYDRLLRDPRGTIAAVLAWLDDGDLDRAVLAVEPTNRTQGPDERADDLGAGLDMDDQHTMVELWAHVDGERPLSPEFVERMNALDRRLRPRVLELEARRKSELVRRMLRPEDGAAAPNIDEDDLLGD